MKVIRIFNAQPVKIAHFKSPLTCKQARWPHFLIAFFLMFISWTLIMPSLTKKNLIVEQFQGNYLKWSLENVADHSKWLPGFMTIVHFNFCLFDISLFPKWFLRVHVLYALFISRGISNRVEPFGCAIANFLEVKSMIFGLSVVFCMSLRKV